MHLKVEKQVTLYKDPRFHAAFPSIIRLDNNELLLAFRRARDCNWLLSGDKDFDPLQAVDHFDARSHLCLINYDEALEQVGEPRIYPIDPEAGDQDPSLLNIGKGHVLMTSFSWYPLPGYVYRKLYSEETFQRIAQSKGCAYQYWGSHSGLSRDNGRTWEFHHEYLDKTDIWQDGTRNKIAGGATRGQCLRVDGELLLANYGNDNRAILWHSKDMGRSWHEKAVIADDKQHGILFQEPTLYQAPSGKLIAFMRTQGADFRLATAVSHDNGLNWQHFELHDDIKGQPFHAYPVGNSHMLLSYGYREVPFGVRCKLLDAECNELDEADEIILRDDGNCADLGYPWIVNITNDSYLIAYYFTDADGIRSIQGTVVAIAE